MVGGEVLLRIEDIDTTRCRPEYEQAIYDDLYWLGFTWPEPVRVQSQHFSDFANCVTRLCDEGLAYRCFRTRAELAALQNPATPGRHAQNEENARLAEGQPYAWRLSLQAAREQLGAKWQGLSYDEQTPQGLITRQAYPERHGDIVIARKDSPSAYHIAATHDDAIQGVTHIIRGEDLIDAPHIHTLLQALFAWPRPIYQHHELLLDRDGQKLSKRQKSVTLARLRADGMTADQIRQRLGFS